MGSASILTEARIKMLQPISGSNRQILIVDDFTDMRMAIRRMLREIGEDNVEHACNGKNALEKMKCTKFDIVLCDYNLGEGKDGHQVLEEARYFGSVTPSCIFIMITAETSVPYVLGAIECQPDDYIAKPFTKELLHHRLQKVMERKRFLLDIYHAIQEKKYSEGILLAEARMKTKSRYVMEITKLLGWLYIKTEDYDAAVCFYQRLLERQSPHWAKFGLGQSKYYLGEIAAAISIFEGLVEDNQYFIEAYDWLAKCRVAMGDAAQALEQLAIASRLSPKTIARQLQLGELAKNEGDLDAAVSAYRAAISYGKHSCFKSAKEYLGMSEILVGRGDTLKALTNLKEARAELQAQPVDLLQILTTSADLHRVNKRDGEASKLLQQAATVYQDNMGDVPDEISIKLAESALSIGDTTLGASIVRSLAENNHDDDELLDQLRDVIEQTGYSESLAEVVDGSVTELRALNKEGISLAEDHRFAESLELFKQVLVKAPDSKAFNLNAALACIILMQNNGFDDNLLCEARAYLARVKKSGKADARYADLTKMLARLTAGQGE
ncbi:Chemotaxis regulator - transmits chemoreceptor signals to flagelllar motor components CheY [hydrothermal vent metagenome]|uniref:Chemotaxis regulator - transmits chemoreceptor signals to flagelllar motor components CheY n=1 Tax=hydrothermal vent metagenome TaxID=652676 RepID=A0A3B1BAS4_9ZZZZ